MFGGTAEPWAGSGENQPKLADTTLLQFSKCIHITLSHPSHCCKSSSQTITTKLITMHWYIQKLGVCRYYNNSWEYVDTITIARESSTVVYFII